MGLVMDASGSQPELPRIHVEAPQHDSSHPAHNVRFTTVAIAGVSTDFLLQQFADRVFVAVTQFNKLGTVLSVERDRAASDRETYEVTTLVGKREEPILELCARRVASSIAEAGCDKPLLIALALLDHSVELLKPILNTINANKVW